MLASIVAISGLVGLVITTGLLTWQTRAAAQQARIANAIAGSTVLHNSSSALREVFLLFVERPGLRPYFYGRKPVPEQETGRDQVLSVGEMFCDILEDGLVANRLVPTSESFEDWTGYCREMLGYSPALDLLVAQNSQWWPQLARLHREARSSVDAESPARAAALGSSGPDGSTP